MKERPILFSAPMVRAILEGRKTQTRRAIKGATGGHWDHGSAVAPEKRAYKLEPLESGEWMFFVRETGEDAIGSPVVRCPYGQPGDRLWVKETHSRQNIHEASGELRCRVQYAADESARLWDMGGDFEAVEFSAPKRWRPSIFMPRWASRITLEIASVRVERLQEISEEDALAEGIRPSCDCDAITAFKLLWESINGPGSWDANPWVWVIEFRRLKP